MPDLLNLEVATPVRQLVREQVTDVQVPGKDGCLGILPGHAALLDQLGAGCLSYTTGTGRHHLAVDGGFVEVLDDHVRVLADMAERAEDIDLTRAQTDLLVALARLSDPAADPAETQAAVNRAQARVTAAEER